MNKNSELQELKKKRDSIIEKLYRVRDELRNAELAENRPLKSYRDELFHLDTTALINQQHMNGDSLSLYSQDRKYTWQEIKMIEFISGIKYRNGDFSWCHNDVYCYKADIITRAVQFQIEVTYEQKDRGQSIKILDMKCHFTDIAESCLQEMIPWVKECTINKKYSLFTLALADYDNRSVNRAKILGALKSKKYIRLEKCNYPGGGILVYVHPHNSPKQVYLQIRWFLKFSSNLLKIRDTFTIKPVEAYAEFMRDNKNLLEKFHLDERKEADIEKLWEKLCEAVDNDYNK